MINRYRLLIRGESIVASSGIALAAILLAVMAASAAWAMHTQRDAAQAGREAQIRTAAVLLVQSVEPLLSANELSATRRLIADVGRFYGLTQCRVVLADGQVLAAAEPLQINVQNLPARWDRRRTADDSSAPGPGILAVSYPINISGHGSAALEITANLTQPLWRYWEAQAGVCATGAAALLALLIVYRRIRAKLRAIGAIREALQAIESGTSVSAELCVSPALGAEASPWNQLLAEVERLRKQSVGERARETLGRRGQPKGDLSAACDAMSQGLILVDDKSNITYANGAAAAFLQAKRDDMAGKALTEFLKVENLLQAIREISNGSSRRRAVVDVERTDEGNAGVLRFSVRPVRREDSASGMIVIEDITQQRVAEEARHAFVAQATHELRTPLTNIRLYVETAIDEGENDPAMRANCLNVINGETRRLERIVGEMLSVAEIEAGSFKMRQDDVRLETIFEELKNDYGPQAAEKQIKLIFNLPPKLPNVKGDRDKMLLAMHNLIGNALKYTPQAGQVTVNVEVSGKQLSVEVRDTGIGISAEDAEKIFERFYRAKDPRVAKITGTGLGLTLAREVARLHGGDITVESQVNEGSRFTLVLPVVAEAA